MPDAYAAIRALPLLAVLSSLGFADWKPRKEGQEFSGPCPVCKPAKNRGNFSFAADGKFRCFSCPVKGRGAIDIVQAVRQCGFQEAVSFLGKLPKFATPLPPPEESRPQSQSQPPSGSSSENPPFVGQYHKYFVPSEWLAKRGFSPATLETFGVGQYDNPKRQSAYRGKILLPVRRWKDGELVAYLARDPRPDAERGSDPKYVWPKGFAKSLEVFGATQIKNAHEGALPVRRVFLVESPFTVLKFAQHGFKAVSCFGWTVSDEQLNILASLAKGLCYCPDRNVYQQAAEQAGKLSTRLWCRFPELPNGIDDPEHLTPDQIRALS